MRKEHALLLFALFFSLIFISGCITETENTFPGHEELSKSIPQDLDLDGTPETITYLFTPMQIENYSFTRIVVVKSLREPGKAWQTGEEEEQNLTFIYKYNDSGLDEVQAHLNTFGSDKRATETECKRILGLDRPDLPCFDRDSCLRACYTPICHPFAMGVGEPFIYSLLDMNNGTKQIDGKVGDAGALVEQLRKNKDNVTKAQYDEMLLTLNELMDLSVMVNGNDIFNPSIYFLCKPINYDMKEIRAATIIIQKGRFMSQGSKNVTLPPVLKPATPDKFTYSSFILINSTQAGTDSSYVELTISDQVPNELGAAQGNLVFARNASAVTYNPVSITWKQAGVGAGEANNLLTYSLITNYSTTGNWLEQNLERPSIRIRQVSLLKSPGVISFIAFMNGIFGIFFDMFGYFISLAIVGALMFVLVFRLLWTAMRFAFKAVQTMGRKGDMRQLLYEFAGHAAGQGVVYAGVGVGMLILGAILINPSSPSMVRDNTIIIDKLLQNVSLEPPHTFGAVLFFLGLVSLYYVAEDYVKGLVLGKQYYVSPAQLVREQNTARLKDLEMQIAGIKSLLEECKRERIDASDVHELIFEIPVQRVKEAMEQKKEPFEVKEILDAAFVKAEAAEARGRDKLSTIRESWQPWSGAIKEALVSKKKVRPEMLLDVPKDWRIWAIERYFNEHSGEGLAMEDGELVAFGGKVGRNTLGDLLKGLIASGKIDGGAIIGANSGLLAAELPRGANKAVIAKMASKMARSASSVTSLFGTQQKQIIVSLAKGKLLVLPAGKATLVFLLPSEANVAQVIRSTDNIAKIVSEIIEE